VTMTLAAVLWNSTDAILYKALLSLHIVMVVAAFGTTFVQSGLLRTISSTTGELAQTASQQSLKITTAFTLPALVVAVVAGVLMVVGSGGFYGFDQAWISASFAVVLVVGLLVAMVMLPAQKMLLSSADKLPLLSRVKIAIGFVHLGFLALVILMVWKPGM
jgi:uncharacterized membrane protein